MVEKHAFAQLDWITGEGHDAQTTTLHDVRGLITRIDILISNVTGTVTTNVAITDENSVSLVSFSSLAKNSKHVKYARSKGATDSDFNGIPVVNDLTVSIDPSADPGGTAQTLSVDVILYVEK